MLLFFFFCKDRTEGALSIAKSLAITAYPKFKFFIFKLTDCKVEVEMFSYLKINLKISFLNVSPARSKLSSLL